MRTLKELKEKCEDYYKDIAGSVLSEVWMEESELWNHIVKQAEKAGFSIWNTRSLKKKETVTLKGRSGEYDSETYFHLSKENISVTCTCRDLPCKTTVYLGTFYTPITTKAMVKKADK